MRFKYSFTNIPGKDVITADTPSRLPILKTDSRVVNFQKEVDALVDLIMNNLPATSIEGEIKEEQVQDMVRTQI